MLTCMTFNELQLQDSVDIDEIARVLHAARLKRDRSTHADFNTLDLRDRAAMENAAAVALRSLDPMWREVADEHARWARDFGRNDDDMQSYKNTLSGVEPINDIDQQRIVDAANAQSLDMLAAL